MSSSPCKNVNEGKQFQVHTYNPKTYAYKRKPDFLNIGSSSMQYLSFNQVWRKGLKTHISEQHLKWNTDFSLKSLWVHVSLKGIHRIYVMSNYKRTAKKFKEAETLFNIAWYDTYGSHLEISKQAWDISELIS